MHYETEGGCTFEDVPLVKCMHLVFTRMPGGVTVGDSGLCCCVVNESAFQFPCLCNSIAKGELSNICFAVLYSLYSVFLITSDLV